jgi:PAS domain S-box-containing protein
MAGEEGGPERVAQPSLTDREGRPFLESDRAMLLTDDRGAFLDANPAALRLLGYPLEELRRKALWDLTPGSELLDGLALWQDFMRGGSRSGRYRLRKRSGLLLDVRYEASANVAPGCHLVVLTPREHPE